MENTERLELAEEPVLVISRRVAAPRHRLWAAFTNPELLAQWYGAPGFTTLACNIELHPGGRWAHQLRAPNGKEFKIEGVYIEVVAQELLQWVNSEDRGTTEGPPSVTQTVTFSDVGAESRWTLVARYANLADRNRSFEMGFGRMVEGSADRLDALLSVSSARRPNRHG